MRCGRFRWLLVLSDAADISESDRQRLQEHEAQCPQCQRFALEVRAVCRLLKLDHVVEVPSAFTQTVMTRIRSVRIGGKAREELGE